MKLTSEWKDRLDYWSIALAKDFYHELGGIDWEGFTTFEHLMPEEVSGQAFVPYPEGTAWGETWEYLWLRGETLLPQEADGKMVVLGLEPGGEATIFVNGSEFGTYRAQGMREAHHYISDNIITHSGGSGERFELLLEVYAGHYFPESPVKGGIGVGPVLPGDYKDPLEGKPRTRLGHCGFGIWNEDAYGLWMDVQTLRDVMESLSEGSLRARKIERALREFTIIVDFEQPLDARIEDYRKAREYLRGMLECNNGPTMPKFYAVGNAHLDISWLWPLQETIRKTARTFAAQLRLLEMYPGYKFLQSQPQSYLMCKEHYPALYERIKAAVRGGRWIAEGGMWVEPDTNMTSGESLIRQLMHGLRFFKEEFGVDCEILWLPDTFGYSAALPQILKGCGIKYLVTQKIFWSYNEGEQFPYHYFTWQGSDGSQIVSYLPTSYTYRTNPKTLYDVWETRVQKDDMGRFLLPYGYGDGGGGPCRDDIEFLVRTADLEGTPCVRNAHPSELFKDLEEDGGPAHTYAGELYFTAHRGVYTSQAKVKRGNRKSEIALREAEMWGALALLTAGVSGGYEYPYAKMDKLRKDALLNQFHDILPGSSIGRVNREAEALFDKIISGADTEAHGAMNALAASCRSSALSPDTASGKGLSSVPTQTVFNSLSWERFAVVTLEDKTHVPVRLPPCGYAPPVPCEIPAGQTVRAVLAESGAVLENGHLRAEFDGNGEIVSFVLKESGREFAAGGMNRFLLYKDVPRVFDAWDIDSNYELLPVDIPDGAEISLLYSTDAKAAVQIKKKISNSALCQTVSLCAMSRRLEFETTVEWSELHRLLKVSFPIDVHTDEVICEIQHGYIKRPNHRSRAYDKDRFEVCNHRYSALCDESHGAAVLNDCKYGVSALGNSINLTLLRAPAAPEMRADNGTHCFTYAFTAWEGAWAQSPAVREGYELNTPPVIMSGTEAAGAIATVPGAVQPRSFFSITGADSVIIDTVKPAEDESGDIVVRLYESKRADCRVVLRWGFPVAKAALTDMLERETEPLAFGDGKAELHFRPFEVKTVRLTV